MQRNKYSSIIIIFFVIGSLLRILLCISNPADNAFDNHFIPISMIMENGEIPAKNACQQCYHPPVFYLLSAAVGKTSLEAGIVIEVVKKIIQFTSCIYGILTIYVIYLILNKMPISNYARVISFGLVCFLPRHIYMSAMNSNDTISYLFVSMCIYTLILVFDNKCKSYYVVLLSLIVSVAMFIKYTDYIILPMLAVLAFVMADKKMFSSNKIVTFVLLSLVLPTLCVSAYMLYNYRTYGCLLPDNILAPLISNQPRDPGGVSFFSFMPWLSIRTPFLAPGNLSSFWTLIFSGMWFDIDAVFIRFFDYKEALWGKYYNNWLIGAAPFPDLRQLVSGFTSMMGSILILLGMVPLFFTLTGIYVSVKNSTYEYFSNNGNTSVELGKRLMFIALLIFNIMLIIIFTMKRPYYSTIKASYILNAMPAYAVFLSYGLMVYERKPIVKNIITVLFGIIYLCLVFHILFIVYKLRYFNL